MNLNKWLAGKWGGLQSGKECGPPLRWTMSSSESKQTESSSKQGDVWEEEKKMEGKTDEWG